MTLPVAGQRDVDQPGTVLGQSRIADTETVGDAGPVVLDHHVGVADQLQRPFQAVARLEVERDRALPSVPRREGGMGSRRVAAGRLDLDDVGALVGKQHTQQRPRDVPSELDDARASKGAGGTGRGHGGLR